MTKRAGLDLIKEYEGLELKAYNCPAGVSTIGYGTTRIDGKPVRLGTTITKEQAQKYAEADYDVFEKKVRALVKVPVNENQLGALVSFAYNLGPQALASSTLLKKLNAKDYDGAAKQFDVWNKARVGGVLKELAGLTRRRNAEEALFLKAVEAPKPKAAETKAKSK